MRVLTVFLSNAYQSDADLKDELKRARQQAEESTTRAKQLEGEVSALHVSGGAFISVKLVDRNLIPVDNQ